MLAINKRKELSVAKVVSHHGLKPIDVEIVRDSTRVDGFIEGTKLVFNLL